MSNTNETSNAREIRLLKRNKASAILGRESVINRLKAIAELSVRVQTEPDLLPSFLISTEELSQLWETFLVKNQAVLDALLDLDLAAEFDTNLETEVRLYYISAMTIANMHKPRFDDSTAQNGRVSTAHSVKFDVDGRNFGSRLPEIPLPTYDGDLSGWPVFRDRFLALVVKRVDLSNIERFYYLLGCLKGEALDAICGINVSEETYELAWSTLTERFDKPRQLAASIVDALLSVPTQSQESLDGLKEFIKVFADQVSMLRTLCIPDMSEFLLFSMSIRCLSLPTRKGFESTNTKEFPTLTDVVCYVKNRVALLEAVKFSGSPKCTSVTPEKSKAMSPQQFNRKPKVVLVASKPTSSISPNCILCSGNHTPADCGKFADLSLDDRFQLVRDKKMCFRCLNPNHWSNKCKVAKPCEKCEGRHHTLLHKVSAQLTQYTRSAETSLVGLTKQPTVLLGTALVHIRDQSGCMQVVRALIDSASQISVISSSCVSRLGLRRTKWSVPVTGLSGVTVPNVDGTVECTITPRFNSDYIIPIRAWILPNITSNMPSCQLSSNFKDKFSHLALADPSFDTPAPIDLLLGADVFSQIWDGKRVVVDKNLPSVFSSLFGWVIIGPVSHVDSNSVTSNIVSLTISLDDIVHRFWQLEEPQKAPISFTEVGRCEAIYTDERIRNSAGRFVVPLPFRNSCKFLNFPGSREIALRRFQNLERKLQSNETLYDAYRKFMRDYELLGHMSVASTTGSYFIPHHPVFKVTSGSNKLRVVFDASAVSASKLSLNQCLYTGPKLQQDIVDILLRFRVHRFVFTADVCKMYRQILVQPKYRRFQHIFWRDSPLDELKEFELHTVTYGLNCAPFLALRVLQDIADQECCDLPDVRDALKRQTYVDDICVGADSVNGLLRLQCDLKAILSRAGFDLKKWSSNSFPVLDTVPVEDRASESLNFDDKEDASIKILGLQWDPVTDEFRYNVQLNSMTWTKRNVLSLIARIYDPLGLLAPVIFFAKHIMQQIWKVNLAWDDPLPSDLIESWESFVSDLPSLCKVRIPRFLATRDQTQVQLCGFCDASERGYAAVVYIRVILPDKTVVVSLLGSKTKMAPMRPSTIPRLELCAAVLLAKWMSRIRDVLADKLIIRGVFAWSDSQIVLSWLVNSHTEFKVFVSNRVHQVQQLLPCCKWYFVRSNANPADCASRGMLPSDLLQHSLYWAGPDCLLGDEGSWNAPGSLTPVEQLPETKVCSLVVNVCDEEEWFSRFSSYTKMLRVVSWMRRFIYHCRRRKRVCAFLSRSEITESLLVIVRTSQRLTLASLLSDLEHQRLPTRSLAGLRPFIDETGIIRVGGRLRHSELPDSHKQPILIAKTSYLSSLIVRHWHIVTCHSGPRVITSLISRQFWIISIRAVIRTTLGSCTICVRSLAQVQHPVMADLPSFRVQSCRPFSRVGVDYAGPLLMRECRLRKARQYKVYIAVFVCMAVKAVHLEIVLDLSTDAFLAALDRFVARRGMPQEVFSDCGTNFVGAAKQLQLLVKHPENQIRISSHVPCVWRFNPPSTPHFGGLWEAAVKSAKTLLVRVMGCHNLTLEELSTVLCRIEAVLNSRPLTPMSSSPLDLDYLTPGHFLIGQPLLAIPDLPIVEGTKAIVQRWKLLHQCHQSFWRRWSIEYLTTLQRRTKWTSKMPNIKIGDMVIIKSDQSPPTVWRLGRVLAVFPGEDGVVRVARILTAQGEVVRPVVKLVLLPTHQN